MSVLPRIDGPYAFVYYDVSTGESADRTATLANVQLQSKSQTLYWARDPLGRRSLLQAKTADGQLLLSSVSCAGTGLAWDEIDASCVYSLALGHGKVGQVTDRRRMQLTWFYRLLSLLDTHESTVKTLEAMRTLRYTLSIH